LSTTPDWTYADLTNPTIKVAVFLDGMSRHLHGDPKQAQKDELLRQALELDGYKVIIVQSKDLDDPEAMRHHLRDIAEAIGKRGVENAGP
jgi:very-short-patch-repair endonuclease